jgi:hypothetical protein
MAEKTNVSGKSISRRAILTAASTTLIGGSILTSSAARAAMQGTPQAGSAPASTNAPGAGRSWICEDGFKNALVNGQKGFQINTRLTGYRGLPLNTVMGAELKIDGQRVDPKGIVLTIDNIHYRLEDLAKLGGGKQWRDVPWWYVLDKAELFCPWEKDLSPGEHVVEGYLLTRGIYGTGGRGEARVPAATTKRLILEAD